MANQEATAHTAGHIAFDGRHPKLLDHRGYALKITAGHVDVFAVRLVEGSTDGARHHLFRAETGEIILDLQEGFNRSDPQIQVLAVGSPGTEAQLVPRMDVQSLDPITTWIRRLARLIAGPNPSWDMLEVASDGAAEIPPDERRRGPARSMVWVSLQAGTAKPMGLEPSIAADGAPLPLTSGMWIEAGQSGCSALGSEATPEADQLWRAVDQFHLSVASCIREYLARDVEREARRLVLRTELITTQTAESFERLSDVVVQRSTHTEMATDSADPLFNACRIVVEAIKMPFSVPPRSVLAQPGFNGAVEIARAARLRVRRTLLRGEWWTEDAGPLVAWHGEARNPVALIRRGNRRYVMLDTTTGTRRPVDRSVAMELAPEAVSFYPALPARPLRFRDLLTFAFRHSTGSFLRIAIAIVAIGLLSLVTPLITNVLINSVIPRSELDQLTFCALALAVTAIAIASIQTMEGLAMLKVEGLMDWRLQAAVIDRVLRLPTSLFREYTVGDFVDRSMGIDAARRVFTGRALRSMLMGVFAWFSIGLMLYYDVKLGLIALLLTLIRALLIIATSALRLYYENKYFTQQGKIDGFVLQLITGIGKLRVADATARALAVWSKQFAAQKRNFISSQKVSNALGVFETAYPLIATLIIFAAATYLQSKLLLDVGGFLAFFSAFGQSMASIGAWASGISESLIAIPSITRLRPLISGAAELSDERKSPGELSGTIELSRVTFRYTQGGPPVLENVSLRIAQGEYVAIVGPSGSGKSSLFRLLLGFEKPESGTVFLDGKAIDTLDISAVRRQLGVVLQNGKLATGSLYDNICGGVQLPLDQAWEAARLAGLEDDIKAMPMGMNTVVAEGVNTLSGGQRQRIMIARAVARRPRVLLFDEATSALDNQSQAIVSNSLGNLNVTRIVIAHRLSTVRQADRIIVLVDGKVVQTGSYDELSNTPGMFASFAKRQLL
ncbi:NHLP bacteriocin export ABC transporter permease/ATPase subunit [Bradyrhizobium sp. AUGA SZCCT0240]|nr:NHLP bacteriocin export ABC transporter permease/ATPase subunit [Bradyrhizobium sp. AUGA SZCCT0158]MBR1243700.1 NHLP bacteriocin export ABC transporter permease/ATPase subunit [Bradyrhizobium sp. AUGA SZCCT0274]MBR1254917.1 NHLP bacteriocin export ABC transporter permease/ATPase subunit [Bradyrhizobium sp. AUGA SZCCT0240]